MIVPASISRQCEDLAQLLGTGCLPYWKTTLRTNPPTDLSSISFAAIQVKTSIVAEVLESAIRSDRSSVVSLDDSHFVFAIPLVETGREQWFAIGCISATTLETAQRMVELATEATRRQHQIALQDQALLVSESELSRCYTERQWLRQLNSQRAIRKRCVGQQSKQAIESLRNLIDAEAIAIFVYQERGAESHGLKSMISGKACWTMDDIRMLMKRVQKPRGGDSVILNQVAFSISNNQLHSCVIVPVGESEPIGYVIGLNRRKQVTTSYGNSDPGFGAGDAELLHEMAGYLLQDGQSNLLIEESEQLVLGTLRAMSNAIEARDPYTHGHSDRVAQVAYEIAVRLQLSEVASQEIYLSGILHDIGKIGIPDSVLLKPGKLDQEELAIIQQHPQIGHKILEELGKLKFALPGVLCHHERVDGNGYPHKFKGDEIPLMARILAVSDAYDAMTSSRVYRTAMGRQRSIEILRNGIGTQWDEEVVHACLEYLAEEELVLTDGTTERQPRTKSDDWRQVSQALRVLQL